MQIKGANLGANKMAAMKRGVDPQCLGKDVVSQWPTLLLSSPGDTEASQARQRRLGARLLKSGEDDIEMLRDISSIDYRGDGWRASDSLLCERAGGMDDERQR
jgi:hypothetical protein